MNDNEKLVNAMHNLRGTMVRDGGWSNLAIKTMDAAIKRITPTAPRPGSIEVRLAVAITDEFVICEGATVERSGNIISDLYERMVDPPTHQAIITACIPRRQVPIIAGTVEETTL